jgi:hypothetical protein
VLWLQRKSLGMPLVTNTKSFRLIFGVLLITTVGHKGNFVRVTITALRKLNRIYLLFPICAVGTDTKMGSPSLVLEPGVCPFGIGAYDPQVLAKKDPILPFAPITSPLKLTDGGAFDCSCSL